jgi:hypothetical protein
MHWSRYKIASVTDDSSRSSGYLRSRIITTREGRFAYQYLPETLLCTSVGVAYWRSRAHSFKSARSLVNIANQTHCDLQVYYIYTPVNYPTYFRSFDNTVYNRQHIHQRMARCIHANSLERHVQFYLRTYFISYDTSIYNTIIKVYQSCPPTCLSNIHSYVYIHICSFTVLWSQLHFIVLHYFLSVTTSRRWG